ncbi:phosphate ABC transporter permease subunit PstC [Alkalibacillus silvisoli]|uniref:Phosphate transport system permease protein n=1 Tax=Alkalibacillus silvisoli TaxID=392823 RepID=A0ABP3K504_9BACI
MRPPGLKVVNDIGQLNNVSKKKLTQKSFVTNINDYLMEKVFLLLGTFAIFILALIVGFLFREGMDALREVGIGEFLIHQSWYPSSSDPRYGALPFIISSIMVTVGALTLAVPWGIFTAIFIAEIAPKRLKEILKPVVEVFAIFPSVVLGFIALVVLSPMVANVFNLSNGLTAITASIILSVMALPTIISIAEDSLNSVPSDFKEAAYALGATKWEVVKDISLPAAKSGIIAAVMLGFGRAVGETMTVLMAAGNAIDMPIREFLGVTIPDFLTSVRTLTANIAIEGSDVAWGSLHYSALFVVGIILFVITFVVNLIADILINRQRGAMRND